MRARLRCKKRPTQSACRSISGDPWRADLVVGADGIKSMVRRHTVGADDPVFTGQVAWRCTVPIERIAPALRTDVVSTIWCGPRNHAVTYYLRGGELLQLRRLASSAKADEESWTARRPWQELHDDYTGWHPMVRAVIEAVDRDQCFRWALNRRTPVAALEQQARHPARRRRARHVALHGPGRRDGDRRRRGAGARTRPRCAAGRSSSRSITAHRGPRTARVIRESDEMGELYHIADAAAMRQAFARS